MSSSMVSSVSSLEGMPIGGARRSRFSFHFKTPSARRWLLVQLVSMPVNGDAEGTEATHGTAFEADTPRRDTLARLVDSYTDTRFTRSWV